MKVIRAPRVGPVELPPSEMRFTPFFYNNLYPYAKDMVFGLTALEMLAKNENADKIIRFLENVQGLDGSWDQDIVVTSLTALAFQRTKINPKINPYRWFSKVQYSEGALPAFNQLACWNIGW